MSTRTLIEIAGYIGSALVLVSFLMTSVVKLRLVNMLGSLISCTYALIIGSYPLALMNFALILINLYFLWKMKHTKKAYQLVKLREGDGMITHLLKDYGEDIEACFPGLDRDFSQADLRLLTLCEEAAAGLAIIRSEGRDARLLLDYSLPKYRDYSLGAFLNGELKKLGYTRLLYSGPDENHRKYLDKMGFEQNSEGLWSKTL